MIRAQSITDLLGEQLEPGSLGENLNGEDLTAGYIPERSFDFIPELQIGPPLIGPVNDQLLQIWRDDRPIATDELGMQGPFTWHKLAARSAGRTVPLNDEWGPANLDPGMPGLLPTGPNDSRFPSPLYWGQDPPAHRGYDAPAVVANPWTVYYTATPQVGWNPEDE